MASEKRQLRVCIVEDMVEDAIIRYSSINKNPLIDLGIVFDLHKVRRSDFYDDSLREAGFDLNKIVYMQTYEKSFPDADIYFIDGLGGSCFSVAEQVGLNKSVLSSSAYELQKMARERGMKVVEQGTFSANKKGVEKIIEEELRKMSS